jgi:hypothetical protein
VVIHLVRTKGMQVALDRENNPVARKLFDNLHEDRDLLRAEIVLVNQGWTPENASKNGGNAVWRSTVQHLCNHKVSPECHGRHNVIFCERGVFRLNFYFCGDNLCTDLFNNEASEFGSWQLVWKGNHPAEQLEELGRPEVLAHWVSSVLTDGRLWGAHET